MKHSAALTALVVCSVTAGAFAARDPAPAQILVWLPKAEARAVSLQDRLAHLYDVLIRFTSPDVFPGSRRLWRMAADGGDRCRLGDDRNIRAPKWGSAGYVLYRQEADTNHDGRIDDLDEDLVRVIPVQGGEPVLVGQGRSATWSPDGHVVAIMHNGKIEFRNLHGQLVPAEQAPEGEVVLADSLDPELVHDFWVVDTHNGEHRRLPDELGKKYLWLTAQAPAGKTVLFASATREYLLVMGAGDQKPRKINQDHDLFIDPAWSPDEQQIVFVSTAPSGEPCRPH
jgi:dipeptidyl aminopeptidase/acylaminoacyl peptidase